MEQTQEVWALVVKSEGMPVQTYQVNKTIAKGCIQYAQANEDIVIAWRVQ